MTGRCRFCGQELHNGFARCLGVSVVSISDIELGKERPTDDERRSLAALFNAGAAKERPSGVVGNETLDPLPPAAPDSSAVRVPEIGGCIVVIRIDKIVLDAAAIDTREKISLMEIGRSERTSEIYFKLSREAYSDSDAVRILRELRDAELRWAEFDAPLEYMAIVNQRRFAADTFLRSIDEAKGAVKS